MRKINIICFIKIVASVTKTNFYLNFPAAWWLDDGDVGFDGVVDADAGVDGGGGGAARGVPAGLNVEIVEVGGAGGGVFVGGDPDTFGGDKVGFVFV